MNKKKLLTFVAFFAILSVFLTGCGTKDLEVTNVLGKEPMGYLLTSNEGRISGFYRDGREYMSKEIGNNNSDFIYAEDEGELFHEKIKDGDYIPKVIYALDKNKSTITVLQINDDDIKVIGEKSIKDGQKIDKIRGLNGKVYYSINDKGIKAKKHSFKKEETYQNSGITDFNINLPKRRSSAIKTYIVIEDLTDYYKEALDLKLEDQDYIKLGIVEEKTSIIEIPYLVNDWTVGKNQIYFFLDGFMGHYNLEKDLISLYYGSKRSIDSKFIGGIDKKVISLSDLGEKGNKSVLLDLDPNYMEVNKAIEFPEGEPLAFSVVKNKAILIAFRNMNKDAKTLSRLQVINYDNYETLATIPVEYVPTKIVLNNDLFGLFNPNEDYFLLGNINSEKQNKYQTTYDDVNYTDIFMFNFTHTSDYNFKEDGSLLNKKNQLIDEDGNLLNKNNEKINHFGQILDEFNRPINKKGEFIDRYNNVIDENGDIIKFVKGTDGYYRNSFGNIVNEKGEPMVKDKTGKWIDAIKEKENIKIEGFYDKDGSYKVKPEILKEYPEAEGILEQQLLEEEKEADIDNEAPEDMPTSKPTKEDPEEPEVISTPKKIEKQAVSTKKTTLLDKLKSIFKK